MSKGLLTVLSDWIVAALALLSAAGVPVGVITGNRKRSKKNQRQLQGDPDNPNHEGVLDISKENAEKLDEQGEKIDELDSKVERVLDRVEELAGDEARRHGDD
jgi:TolA-binding protein